MELTDFINFTELPKKQTELPEKFKLMEILNSQKKKGIAEKS